MIELLQLSSCDSYFKCYLILKTCKCIDLITHGRYPDQGIIYVRSYNSHIAVLHMRWGPFISIACGSASIEVNWAEVFHEHIQGWSSYANATQAAALDRTPWRKEHDTTDFRWVEELLQTPINKILDFNCEAKIIICVYLSNIQK